MNMPTDYAQFALNQFLVYQQKIDEHHFYNEEDKKVLESEADYWRSQYEAAEDTSVIKSLGLTTVPNP